MSNWLKEFDKMMYRHTYIKNAVSDDCIDEDTWFHPFRDDS